MSTRDYGIRYKVDGAEASKQAIEGLKAGVLSLHAAANSGKGSLSAGIKVSAADVAGLDKAATALGTIGATGGSVGIVAEHLKSIYFVGPQIKTDLAAIATNLKAISAQQIGVANVAAALGNLGNRSAAGRVEAEGLSGALRGVSDRKTGLADAGNAVQVVQRKLFGAKMNAVELGNALDAIPAKAAGLSSAATAVGEIGQHARAAKSALRGAAGGGRSLGRSLMGLSAGLNLLSEARRVAAAVGEAINSSREKAESEADRIIAMKDKLREVATLRGESSPGDATVEAMLRLRTSAGMSTDEADGFMRKFYGSIEAGKGKGNITDAVAEDIQPMAATLGIRTKMGAATAGDLAASLSNYGKIESAKQAEGQMGVIVDQLNKGRGDMQPLTEALLKTAGTTVGPKGSAFANLPQLSAAIGVASNSASPTASGTRIEQTMRGLSYGHSEGQNATLKKYGITGEDDFATRVRKIKPFIDEAEAAGKNPMDMLKDAGFGNITDRRGIVYFARNQKLLQDRLGEVDAAAGADGKFTAAGDETEKKNAEYRNQSVARDRIGKATLDAELYRRYRGDADTQTKRKFAEAELNKNHKIDSAGTNKSDAGFDLFGLLPTLGFRSSRRARIDNEVERQEQERIEANRREILKRETVKRKVAVGPSTIPGAGNPPIGTTKAFAKVPVPGSDPRDQWQRGPAADVAANPRDQWQRGPAVDGGKPLELEKLMASQIAEQKRTNDLLSRPTPMNGRPRDVEALR